MKKSRYTEEQIIGRRCDRVPAGQSGGYACGQRRQPGQFRGGLPVGGFRRRAALHPELRLHGNLGHFAEGMR